LGLWFDLFDFLLKNPNLLDNGRLVCEKARGEREDDRQRPHEKFPFGPILFRISEQHLEHNSGPDPTPF